MTGGGRQDMTQISDFGLLPDGQPVQRISISGGGLTAQVLTYGATVQDLRLDGVTHPLVLGSPTLRPYLTDFRYFGAIVGRFANRIGGGQFSLGGMTYALDRNDGGVQTLHGGVAGAGQMVWQIGVVTANSVSLQSTMADGHMGFPGQMVVQARYSLPGPGILQIDIQAQTDAPSPCSFAHHGYFNLEGAGPVTDHVLQIDAEHYLPVDATLIPTGQIAPVSQTPFDFRVRRAVGDAGYDHNFCLSDTAQPLHRVARLQAATSGLSLTLATTEPGLQVYDGAKIPVRGLAGLDGRTYGPKAGIALETQSWPDAPNRRDFPDCILRPGETYATTTQYQFNRTAEAAV